MAKGFEHESDTITEVNCEKSYINILWNGLIWKCPESGRLIKSLVGETKTLIQVLVWGGEREKNIGQ